MQPLELNQSQKIAAIEIAAYTVCEHAKAFRNTPLHPEVDYIRELRLNLLNDAVNVLQKAMEQ